MLQDVAQAFVRHERDIPIAAFTPFRELVIQRLMRGFNLVAQRLKQPAKKGFTTAARHDCNLHSERDFFVGEILPVFAAPAKSSSEGPRKSDAGKRRGNIRTIVDVLIEQAALAGGTAGLADQSDGIDFEQQSGGASLRRRLRIEDVSLTKG
jgi:hypothetical protein